MLSRDIPPPARVPPSAGLRTVRALLLPLLLSLPCVHAYAQPLVPAEDAGRPRYAGHLLSFGLNAGATRYIGDFDASIGSGEVALSVAYTLVPELALKASAAFGHASWRRAPTEGNELLYAWQFGSAEARETSADYSAFDVLAQWNFFPDRFFNLWLAGGIGRMIYQPEDYAANRVHVRPKAEYPSTWVLPVALGAEYFLTRWMALTLRARWTFIMAGDFDAFDPSALANEYAREHPQEPAPPVHATGNDAQLSVNAGVSIYLFESADYDKDRLSNREEEGLGTNPYRPDTDEDSLSDYEEVRVLSTDPLNRDTDSDGLGDYLEINHEATDPRNPDTDDDRLTDGDEVLVHGTNPRKPDTDDDRLSDYEEVIVSQTNPLAPDTDHDGLDDFVEVKVQGTNPLVPDTDDDGVYDFNEVTTYRTDPRKADTDDDLLTDRQEVEDHATNPLNADTDGDRVGDGDEVLRGMNPLKQDTRTEEELVALAASGALVLAMPSRGGEPASRLIGTQRLPGGGRAYLIVPATSDSAAAGDAATGSRADGAQAAPGAVNVPIRIDTLHLRKGDMLSFCNITFEFNSDDIRASYLPVLDEAARLFAVYPRMAVEIRGHADEAGGAVYNMQLSERRAQAVLRHLQRRGIAVARMRAVGFGETQPIADGTTEEGRTRNRRVEFVVLNAGSRTAQPPVDGRDGSR